MMPAIKKNQLPRVLVIEDDRLLQMIHENLLTRMGFNVVIAKDAEAAINLWNEHWDIIFSDIGLPDMFGTDLCKLRREYEKEKGLPRTPSFAYTAFGDTMRDECLSAGFDDFGVKPMDNSVLYTALQALLPDFTLTPLKSLS